MIRRGLLHTKQHADAPIFMLSEEAVQDEIVQRLAKAAATSVDVERKHHQDKQFEKKRRCSPSVAGSSCATIFDERRGR